MLCGKTAVTEVSYDVYYIETRQCLGSCAGDQDCMLTSLLDINPLLLGGLGLTSIRIIFFLQSHNDVKSGSCIRFTDLD